MSGKKLSFKFLTVCIASIIIVLFKLQLSCAIWDPGYIGSNIHLGPSVSVPSELPYFPPAYEIYQVEYFDFTFDFTDMLDDINVPKILTKTVNMKLNEILSAYVYDYDVFTQNGVLTLTFDTPLNDFTLNNHSYNAVNLGKITISFKDDAVVITGFDHASDEIKFLNVIYENTPTFSLADENIADFFENIPEELYNKLEDKLSQFEDGRNIKELVFVKSEEGPQLSIEFENVIENITLNGEIYDNIESILITYSNEEKILQVIGFNENEQKVFKIAFFLEPQNITVTIITDSGRDEVKELTNVNEIITIYNDSGEEEYKLTFFYEEDGSLVVILEESTDGSGVQVAAASASNDVTQNEEIYGDEVSYTTTDPTSKQQADQDEESFQNIEFTYEGDPDSEGEGDFVVAAASTNGSSGNGGGGDAGSGGSTIGSTGNSDDVSGLSSSGSEERTQEQDITTANTLEPVGIAATNDEGVNEENGSSQKRDPSFVLAANTADTSGDFDDSGKNVDDDGTKPLTAISTNEDSYSKDMFTVLAELENAGIKPLFFKNLKKTSINIKEIEKERIEEETGVTVKTSGTIESEEGDYYGYEMIVNSQGVIVIDFSSPVGFIIDGTETPVNISSVKILNGIPIFLLYSETPEGSEEILAYLAQSSRRGVADISIENIRIILSGALEKITDEFNEAEIRKIAKKIQDTIKQHDIVNQKLVFTIENQGEEKLLSVTISGEILKFDRDGNQIKIIEETFKLSQT